MRTHHTDDNGADWTRRAPGLTMIVLASLAATARAQEAKPDRM